MPSQPQGAASGGRIASSSRGESASAAPLPRPRFDWLDGAKGIAILWIVFFHFFNTYTNSELASPVRARFFATFMAACRPVTALARASCYVESLFVGLSYLGFHAVAVFLVASGFGLTYSIAGRGNPENGWSGWYRSRVIRLYPMYWLAHIVFLISPFQFRPEPIDYRFVLSFLGDRIYPIQSIFYYGNSAWWYFSLILELYLVFPFLFRLLQKVGPAWFLILCGAETIISRYLILSVFQLGGEWTQGGFFGCRLWEFAFGMVLGLNERKSGGTLEASILSVRATLAGLAIYTLGLYCYRSTLTYTFTDALTGTGLFLILCNFARLVEVTIPRAGRAIGYIGLFCYGLYLLHEPYVIYLGIRMRWMSMPEFVLWAAAIIIVMAIVSAQIERYVNQVTNRVLGGASPRVAPG
jgi:peptidoglycan/LPS O-acetylase OafA/YrhL